MYLFSTFIKLVDEYTTWTTSKTLELKTQNVKK